MPKLSVTAKFQILLIWHFKMQVGNPSDTSKIPRVKKQCEEMSLRDDA